MVTAIGSSGNGNWRSLAIAPDGVTQLVGASGGVWPTNYLYKSTNYGASFSSIPGTDSGWTAVGLSNTVGTSTTTTSTTANPNYDYYLADEYNCSGCNITSTNVLVGFPTGTSVIINRFYADIGGTGFVYQITQSTSPGSPAVLLTLPSTTSCAGACIL
jgi:hypothetical protein